MAPLFLEGPKCSCSSSLVKQARAFGKESDGKYSALQACVSLKAGHRKAV